jgi:hypothetical protein
MTECMIMSVHELRMICSIKRNSYISILSRTRLKAHREGGNFNSFVHSKPLNSSNACSGL